MSWPLLVSAYVLANLVIGLLFHLAAWFDSVGEPKPAELVMFFAVFSLAGIPVVLATAFFSALSHALTQRSSNLFESTEVLRH